MTALEFILHLAAAFVIKVLARAAKVGWEEMWQQIFEAVASVEHQLTGQPGAAKRAEAVKLMVEWMKTHTSMNAIELVIVRWFVGKAIDATVKGLNDTLDHDWVKAANGAKLRFEGLVPILAGNDQAPPQTAAAPAN